MSTDINTRHTAKLANLTLTDKEHEEMQSQLSDIVGYIQKLNSVDTSKIEPTAQVTGLKNVTRDDEKIEDSLTSNEALSGTEKKHNDLFVVDKLVDTQ